MSQPTVSGVAPTTGITLSDEDVGENARSAAVISSPFLGVFAVNPEGYLLRRGHVIWSLSTPQNRPTSGTSLVNRYSEPDHGK